MAASLIFIALTASFLPFIMHKTGASSLKEQKVSFSAYIDSGVLLGTVVKQIEALINSIKDVKKGCKGSQQFAIAGFMDDKKGSIFLAMTKPEKLGC